MGWIIFGGALANLGLIFGFMSYMYIELLQASLSCFCLSSIVFIVHGISKYKKALNE
jgi:hypothetical protein